MRLGSITAVPGFPNSHQDPVVITSPFNVSYNCIAWAFGDNTKWYWPDPQNTYYWPPNIPREITLSAFEKLYELIGYKKCSNGSYDPNIEKIAVFSDNNDIPTHAARQLSNGFWTSKLGRNIDVQHTIFSMEGGPYGHVSFYMCRKREH